MPRKVYFCGMFLIFNDTFPQLKGHQFVIVGLVWESTFQVQNGAQGVLSNYLYNYWTFNFKIIMSLSSVLQSKTTIDGCFVIIITITIKYWKLDYTN